MNDTIFPLIKGVMELEGSLHIPFASWKQYHKGTPNYHEESSMEYARKIAKELDCTVILTDMMVIFTFKE